MSVIQAVLLAGCALVALDLLYVLVRDHRPAGREVLALAALEVVVAAQAIAGLVLVAGPHAGVNVPAYLGYLFGALLILPVGFVWAAGERSRSGVAVLLVAVLILPVLVLRLNQLWSARA